MPSDASLLSTIDHEKQSYVRCQTIGHAWFEYENSDWKPEWGVPLVLRCERCGMERRDKIDRVTGELLPGGRHYVRPPGYQYARGERPTKAEFRRMLLEQRIREARAARRLKAVEA